MGKIFKILNLLNLAILINANIFNFPDNKNIKFNLKKIKPEFNLNPISQLNNYLDLSIILNLNPKINWIKNIIYGINIIHIIDIQINLIFISFCYFYNIKIKILRPLIFNKYIKHLKNKMNKKVRQKYQLINLFGLFYSIPGCYTFKLRSMFDISYINQLNKTISHFLIGLYLLIPKLLISYQKKKDIILSNSPNIYLA